MPQQQAQGDVTARKAQTQNRNYIVFRAFETMDTQSDRVALDPKRPNWLENLQPISGNELQAVPGPSAALTTIAGQTIVKKFYANYGGNDYEIAFTQSGAGYQVNLGSGAQVQFAAPGSFSDPDMTQWKSERILIADSLGGYATWDGTVYVKAGGVSPTIRITNGGSGYGTPPAVTISGGTGVGATASATVVGGVVTAVTLTNPGSGFVAGDVLTVAFGGPGAGAAATAIIWPILSFSPTTVAVFQGRVWLAGGRVLSWTGTTGFDDTNPANAAGQATISDADLVRSVTALRNLNNYLYIFGDNSIKQIGTITVSGSNTLFTITTLSSDQGTTFPQSIASYNRLVVFANQVGVWAVFGASVEKISDPMDGIFKNIDFSQKPVACPIDLRNIRVFMLLVKFNDPGPVSIGNAGGGSPASTRSIFLAFMNRKWFVISQGASIRAAMSAPVGGSQRVYASSDVTRILSDESAVVDWYVRTALADDGKPMMNKRALRVGIAQSSFVSSSIDLTTDSENNSILQTYNVAFPVTWVNALGQVVDWVNALSQFVVFVGAGFIFTDAQAAATGIYLGLSLKGSFPSGYHINGMVLEYIDSTLMRSRNTA